MKLWLDAHLAPALAPWLAQTLSVEVVAARDSQLQNASDQTIFTAARSAGAVAMTKDRDFVSPLARLGPPPQVFWIACGNTSNARMREVLARHMPAAMQWLAQGEPLVEISDRMPGERELV